MFKGSLLASALILATTLMFSTKTYAANVPVGSQTSFGLQIGGLLNAGVAGQRLNIAQGAINGSVGLFFGTLILAADYIYFFNDGSTPQTYDDMRGKWTPYVGGGAQIGWGLAVRGLGGVQYTMPDQPFNFYGAIMAVAGTDDDLGGRSLFLFGMLGARLII